MRKWTFIHAAGHKVIFASPEVVELVRATLKKRNAEVIDDRAHEPAWIDRPGMTMASRGYWKGEVDGLKIEIPYTDFHSFLVQLKENATNPGFNGDNDQEREYRSVYGWMHCIAMTQSQYDELLRLMITDADAVQVLADEENERFTKAIERVNEDLRALGNETRVISARAGLAGKSSPVGGRWN